MALLTSNAPAPNRWVVAPPKKSLIVGMADMVASNDASAQLVTYSLGSCVGITVYDPEHKVGGMLQGREKARVVPSGWHFSDFQRKSAFPQQQPHSGILSRPTAWLS